MPARATGKVKWFYDSKGYGLDEVALCQRLLAGLGVGPKGKRSQRYLSTAFNDGPVKRDTRKTRELILSDWYQALWPEVQLIRTAELSFANNST